MRKAEIAIRLASEGDKSAILRLLNEEFRSQQRSANLRGDAFWAWKFQNNVFGKGALIVAEKDEQIIATSTLWPWKFISRGQVFSAYQACDTLVHPDFQGKGIFKSLNRARLKFAQEQRAAFIFNFPNQNSLYGYQSMGWEFLGKLDWHVKLLRPVSIVKGMLNGQKATNKKIEDRVLIDPAYCEAIIQRDKQFEGQLKIYRKPGFFRWRYTDHPSREYGMISAGKKRKAAAAIFTLTQKGQNIEMVVVDMLGHPSSGPDLFKALTSYAKSIQASFIAVVANSTFQTQTLWKSGFVKRKMKNLVVLPLDLSLESKLLNYNHWELVAGLHDSI